MNMAAESCICVKGYPCKWHSELAPEMLDVLRQIVIEHELNKEFGYEVTEKSRLFEMIEAAKELLK